MEYNFALVSNAHNNAFLKAKKLSPVQVEAIAKVIASLWEMEGPFCKIKEELDRLIRPILEGPQEKR